MTRIHSIYSNEDMYKLKNDNHIQTHTHTVICQTRNKKYFEIFKVRTMAIFFAVDVG